MPAPRLGSEKPTPPCQVQQTTRIDLTTQDGPRGSEAGGLAGGVDASSPANGDWTQPPLSHAGPRRRPRRRTWPLWSRPAAWSPPRSGLRARPFASQSGRPHLPWLPASLEAAPRRGPRPCFRPTATKAHPQQCVCVPAARPPLRKARDGAFGSDPRASASPKRALCRNGRQLARAERQAATPGQCSHATRRSLAARGCMAAAGRLHRPASDLTLRMRPTRLHTDVVKVRLLEPAVSVPKPAAWCRPKADAPGSSARVRAPTGSPVRIRGRAMQFQLSLHLRPVWGRPRGLAPGAGRCEPPLSGSQRSLPPRL